MTKRIKIPKRIAGMKIPKGVRKGPVVDFLNSTAGQVVLAQTLVAAGGLFALKQTDENSDAGQTLRHPVEAMKSAQAALGDRADVATSKLTRAFAAAGKAFRAALEEEEDMDRDGAEPQMSAPATAPSLNEDNAATPSSIVARGETSDEAPEATEVTRKKSRVRSDTPSTPH